MLWKLLYKYNVSNIWKGLQVLPCYVRNMFTMPHCVYRSECVFKYH